jgi:cytochrome b561
MFKNSQESYGLMAKILHWGMAVLIFGLIGIGLYMAGLPDEDPNRGQLYALHKAFGSLLLILAILRIIWIFIDPPPPPPGALQPFEVRLSKIIKILLYILMLAVPFSGYAMSTFFGYPVSFFGLFDLPMLFAESKEMGKIAAGAHEILSYVLIGVIVLHILGALKHRLTGNREADVLSRML